METKHTPGKWNVTDYDGNGPMDVESDENPGATLALVYGETKESQEANARLIAAAPEMLELIKHLDDLIGQEGVKKTSPTRTRISDLISKIEQPQ